MLRTTTPRRTTLRTTGILSLVVVLTLLTGCDPGEPPVLGVAAAGGFLDGVRLALEDEEREAGPLPPMDTVLVLEYSSLSAPALQVAQEMAARPGITAVIGHANSTASLATSQVYNRRRIVQVAPTSSAPLYSEAGPYSFRLVPPDDGQGRFLAEKIERSFPDGARLALLFVNDDYGRSLRQALLDALRRDRFSVVLDLPHLQGDLATIDVDFHLDALEEADPDLLVWLGRIPALADLLPGLRRRMSGLPILGGDALSQAQLMDPLPPVWDGISHVDFVDMESSPDLGAFAQRFRERFGARAGAVEALSYDAGRLLVGALREGARSGEEVREHLMSLGRSRPPYPGLTGPIQFDENGDVTRDYVLGTIGVPSDP
jgi:branched-chain amino acid transport system substrate-binding protein